MKKSLCRKSSLTGIQGVNVNSGNKDLTRSEREPFRNRRLEQRSLERRGNQLYSALLSFSSWASPL